MNVRAVSVLSTLLLASSVSLVAAQPKTPPKDAPKDAPKGDAKAPAAGDPAAPAGETPPVGGQPVTMPEDPPPKDIDGRDENPDAPKGDPNETPGVVLPAKQPRSGYPMEEVLRPITLPENMSEVSIGPHLQIDRFEVTDALRARYGITRQVQIGLTYVYAGVYDDPSTVKKDYAVHGGKAVSLDVTVLLQNWIGVRVAVPFYVDPVAVGIQLGAPLRFVFADKLAIGGLDDLLEIDVSDKFAPSLYSEGQNAAQAFSITSGQNNVNSRGALRFSAYGTYQQTPQLAITGRIGVKLEDFGADRGASSPGSASAVGGNTTFLRVGVLYAVKKYFDIGGSLGLDDLAEVGTFGPSAFLNFRI